MIHPDTYARLSEPAQLKVTAYDGIGAYHYYSTFDAAKAAQTVLEARNAAKALVDHPDANSSTLYVVGPGAPSELAATAYGHLEQAAKDLSVGADPIESLRAAAHALHRIGYTIADIRP